MNALDLMPRGLRLLLVQLRGCGARESPLRPVHNRHHHLQIAQQFGAGPGWCFVLCLSLRFEKQVGSIQDAFADCGRTFAPRGIQLAGLARIAVMLSEDGRHPLAILQALACHRHQKLHRYLCPDLPLAHLLLDRLRQNLHQRQSPRDPAHTAIKPAGQLVEPVAETLLQLRQQPTHLQRSFVFG